MKWCAIMKLINSEVKYDGKYSYNNDFTLARMK